MAWLSEVDRAYIAGIIDSEGSIGISRDYRPQRGQRSAFHRSRMRITNTSKELIDYLEDRMDGQGMYHINTRNSRAANRRTTYEIEIGDRLTVKLLKEVLPYLIIKRRHALNVLAFKETFSGFGRGNHIPAEIIQRREDYYLAQKELNKRGAGVLA